LGVGGTINNNHTLEPFKELGLDYSHGVKKLTSKLHVCLISDFNFALYTRFYSLSQASAG